jgi:hypothetical protein
MTKEEIIAELKTQNPTLKYGINNEVFEMSLEEYEATIESWANARIAKEQAKAEAETIRATKISAYEKLGLTADEIEALLPSPQPKKQN